MTNPTTWLLAAVDETPVLGEAKRVLWTDYGIWEFDYAKDGWVNDPQLFSIFMGDPRTVPVSEDDARATIERNGGTWSDPTDAARAALVAEGSPIPPELAKETV